MLGMSRKPDSSRKTRWAPRLCAFFYMWPLLVLPTRDGGLVPFPGLGLGFLATPPQADQRSPDVIGMVVDPKAPVDHLGNPAGGPKIRGKARGLWPG